MAGESSSDAESNVTVGTLLVLLQCSAMASIIVFQRPLLRKYQPSLLTFIYYSIGSLITVLLCICWEFRFSLDMFYFQGMYLPWVALAYAAIFATLINYNMYSYVGKVLSPSIITIYSTVQPISTAILSLLFLDSVVTLSEVVGGALVILGLVLTVYGRHRELALSQAKYPSLRQIMDRDPTDQSSKTIIPFSRRSWDGDLEGPSSLHSPSDASDCESGVPNHADRLHPNEQPLLSQSN
jgi:uncharacterized membrane protein